MPVTALAISRVDVADGFQHAFAEVAGFVAVAKFVGFVFAGGSAGRNCAAADGAAFEVDVGFDGGIAARIDNFAAVDAVIFVDILSLTVGAAI